VIEALALAARLVLAAAFLVAGLGKLADLRGARAAIAGFGFPSWVATPGAVALPVVEVLVALLLIPSPTAAVGAVAALLLLLGFSGGITRSMARGREADCGCFGSAARAAAGPGALLRNLALVGLACLVLVEALAA
jgi:uncharacterized membrane protein YphA (DoxX/SURF4 family)